MGLGIFRPRVTEPDTIPLYFEAQLTVLQNNDYAFDTVFLNPGANKKELLDVLSRRQWRFPFHLKVHHCDAKSVANHLAKIGKRSCILIPADFLSVLQVCPSPPPPPPAPLQGAQPMPSHCPPDGKCQPQWHL